MKVLITGADGQLGWELQRTAPSHSDVYAYGKQDLDICDPQRVQKVVAEVNPRFIINAAAYTAVDRAEQDSDMAYAINRDGAAHLAQTSASQDVCFIHISTDYIFDGTLGRPYKPDDSPNPLCIYGASKLAGERAVFEALSPDQVLIIRTSWVYSAHGLNFVKTMLRLMVERDQLNIVADQIGSPTWSRGLAEVIWKAIGMKLSGLYHWSDAGVASWYDFAVAIQEEASNLGLVNKKLSIKPINTTDFSQPAVRPTFSVLDKTKTWNKLNIESPLHWRESLRVMLGEMVGKSL